jgi:hypothetical protein
MDLNAGHVITVDRIWSLSSSGDPLLASCPQIKDLCLSFALFKLQLRRFIGCPLAEAGCHRAMAFVQDGLLAGSGSPERVFRVVEAELSFLADFLYSKLTVFYASGWWFPALNSILVLATWISCLAAGGAIVHDMTNPGTALAMGYQNLRGYLQHHDTVFHVIVGLDILVSVSFIVSIVFTEGWEIANYVCSDWIKVSAICEYARRPTWRKSPWARRKLSRLLWLRPMQQWDDRFCQVSILQLRFCYCGCVSRQVDRIVKKTVAVPAAVKSAIVVTLRTTRVGSGTASGPCKATESRATSSGLAVLKPATTMPWTAYPSRFSCGISPRGWSSSSAPRELMVANSTTTIMTPMGRATSTWWLLLHGCPATAPTWWR